MCCQPLEFNRKLRSPVTSLAAKMRLLTSTVLFLAAILACTAQAQYPRPRRPERFDTAEQISNYLKELQEYYSVHGRGRYGKRQDVPVMHIPESPSAFFRQSPLFDRHLNGEGTYKMIIY